MTSSTAALLAETEKVLRRAPRITKALSSLLHATYLDGPPTDAQVETWRGEAVDARSAADDLARLLSSLAAALRAEAERGAAAERVVESVRHAVRYRAQMDRANTTWTEDDKDADAWRDFAHDLAPLLAACPLRGREPSDGE